MPNSPLIRVVLIDDQRRVHEAVGIALSGCEDIRLVGHGSNGAEALELCADLKPDLVLMDVVMPGVDGIETTRVLHTRFPTIKILVLSAFQDDESVRAMLHSGAVGYVVKSALAHDLAPAIRTAMSGQSVFSAEVVNVLLQKPAPTQDFRLTEREREVLRAMADGLNNVEIAEKLVISASTVKFHITNIEHKMGVETRAEAIVLAAKNNLV
jgi:two-component system, NarL family, response regulator LiaR